MINELQILHFPQQTCKLTQTHTPAILHTSMHITARLAIWRCGCVLNRKCWPTIKKNKTKHAFTYSLYNIIVDWPFCFIFIFIDNPESKIHKSIFVCVFVKKLMCSDVISILLSLLSAPQQREILIGEDTPIFKEEKLESRKSAHPSSSSLPPLPFCGAGSPLMKRGG